MCIMDFGVFLCCFSRRYQMNRNLSTWALGSVYGGFWEQPVVFFVLYDGFWGQPVIFVCCKW